MSRGARAASTMAASPNPFAAFAFQAPAAKRQRGMKSGIVGNTPWNEVGAAVSNPAVKALAPPIAADIIVPPHVLPCDAAVAPAIASDFCVPMTISHDAPDSSSTDVPTLPLTAALPSSLRVELKASISEPSVATKLAEYRLIAAYRDTSKASVDDFHAFLVGLGTGTEPDVGSPRHGRFWALVACLLSVQCRDNVALLATRDLLRRCTGQGAEGVAALADDELESLVRRCNFCVTKAKNVRAAAAYAVAHGGRVPSSYDRLLGMTGVGPKIAHLMRSVAYGEQDAGIVVDTHVFRVATKLGWVDGGAALSGAERVRQQLERWVPTGERIAFSLAVVGFGQLSRGGREWGQAFVEHVRRTTRGGSEEEGEAAVRLAQSIVHRLGGDDGAEQGGDLGQTTAVLAGAAADGGAGAGGKADTGTRLEHFEELAHSSEPAASQAQPPR